VQIGLTEEEHLCLRGKPARPAVASSRCLRGRNGGITLEGGGGVTGQLTRNVSVYGDASYLSSVSGESRITLKGNVGLRVTW
jgi:outer membrane autotransporter protein